MFGQAPCPELSQPPPSISLDDPGSGPLAVRTFRGTEPQRFTMRSALEMSRSKGEETTAVQLEDEFDLHAVRGSPTGAVAPLLTCVHLRLRTLRLTQQGSMPKHLTARVTSSRISIPNLSVEKRRASS